MGMTLTRVKGGEDVHGHRRSVLWLATFDNSYGIGGEDLTARQLGLSHVQRVATAEDASGLQFRYDIANQKLLAMEAASYLVDEVTGTIGTTYTLKYLPAYIVAIRGTAGATGAKKPIPQSGTNGAGLVRVNWTTGVLTFGDAGITAARIVYVPRGVPGFQSTQMVIDESVTVAGASATLANVPLAVQYIYDTGAPGVVTPIQTADTPAATQAKLTFSTGVLTLHAGVAGPLLVTYIKAVGNPLILMNQTSRAIASNQIVLAGPSIYLPAFGPYIPTSNSGTPVAETLLDRGGTAAANAPTWDPLTNIFTFSGTLSTAEIPLIAIDPSGQVGGVNIEVPSATDLSYVTNLLLEAIGY